MASPSGEPEWANPREIVRTIVTMSQMCRRKPNTPLRFLVISDIFPFQRRGQLGESRKALPRFRQPSIQQSTESNHNHEARWRVQVGSEKTSIQPTLYRTFFDPGIQSSLLMQRKSRRSRIDRMVGTS